MCCAAGRGSLGTPKDPTRLRHSAKGQGKQWERGTSSLLLSSPPPLLLLWGHRALPPGQLVQGAGPHMGRQPRSSFSRLCLTLVPNSQGRSLMPACMGGPVINFRISSCLSSSVPLFSMEPGLRAGPARNTTRTMGPVLSQLSWMPGLRDLGEGSGTLFQGRRPQCAGHNPAGTYWLQGGMSGAREDLGLTGLRKPSFPTWHQRCCHRVA